MVFDLFFINKPSMICSQTVLKASKQRYKKWKYTIYRYQITSITASIFYLEITGCCFNLSIDTYLKIVAAAPKKSRVVI